MATEKDKVIAELCGIDRLATGDKLPDKSTYAWLAIVDRIWEAARADAIEECAQIAEEIPSGGWGYKRLDADKEKFIGDSIAARLRSRKQEGKA